MRDLSLATDFLHHVPPFNLLHADELSLLARGLEAAYYPQGQKVFDSSPPPGPAVFPTTAVAGEISLNSILPL